MESQSKASAAMVESNGRGSHKGGGVGASRNRSRVCELLLRVLALVLTLAAAVVLAVDKQTKIIPIKILDTLPAVNIPVQAKWHYLSAFVYCVVSNAIASAYAAASLALSAMGKKGGEPLVVVCDLLMVALLFSSIGAGGAIGLIGYEGNSRVQWKKVCNVFGKFCEQAAAALFLSLLAAIVFLLLIVIAVLRLHNISRFQRN